MRTPILFLIAVMFLPSCARIRVAHWDGDKVEYCGNRFADESDFNKMAEQRCGSGAYRAIAGGQEVTGMVTFGNAYGSSYGNAASASYSGMAAPVYENCVVYECSTPQPSPANAYPW